MARPKNASLTQEKVVEAHPHCGPLLARYMLRHDMFGECGQTCQFLAAFGVSAQLHVRIVVEGLTSDELFGTFLRTYLNGILDEVPKSATSA